MALDVRAMESSKVFIRVPFEIRIGKVEDALSMACILIEPPFKGLLFDLTDFRKASFRRIVYFIKISFRVATAIM